MPDQTALELNDDADRRLLALARSARNGEPCSEHGGVNTGLAIIVGCVGLFLWGFSHGATRPDGKWLLAMVIVAAMLACLVAFGRSCRAAERRSAAYTEKVEGRVKQHRGSEHFLDGA